MSAGKLTFVERLMLDGYPRRDAEKIERAYLGLKERYPDGDAQFLATFTAARSGVADVDTFLLQRTIRVHEEAR